MNEAYYGNGAYGIETAAKTYFHTTAAELTLKQAALLAGVAPRGQGAEVHEREAHRLLDLVGELARQQHPGAVRFHQLDAVDGVCVARRLQQRGDQRGQGVAHANHCKAAHPPAA